MKTRATQVLALTTLSLLFSGNPNAFATYGDQAKAPMSSWESSTPAKGVDHLVIMVFDQMRADYIEQYNLQNFKRLQKMSHNYPKAYVGHLGAQTVVSHLVIPTGLPPKYLPWQDDVTVDRDGAIGPANHAWNVGDLKHAKHEKLLAKIPRNQFLAQRVRDHFGGKVFSVGEKNYSSLIMGTTADAVINLEKDPSGKCVPSGVNPPDYITKNDRFTVDCTKSYGTGLSTLYSLDGSHYVPGDDPAHLGGDIWAADAALTVMKNEKNWSGLFMTFGAIDKVGHMLGEQEGRQMLSVQTPYHLDNILRTADQQLGRILDELQTENLLNRTMIIVTADRGGQANDIYLGNNKTQSLGTVDNEVTAPPPYWMEHIDQVGKVLTAYADTSVSIWVTDPADENNKKNITNALSDIACVQDIYSLQSTGGDWKYVRTGSPQYKKNHWGKEHNEELVNTMAGPTAPELVALLQNECGFGRRGGHGGAQERSQRIPLIISVPGTSSSTEWLPLRLMDISDIATRTLGLAPAPLVKNWNPAAMKRAVASDKQK